MSHSLPEPRYTRRDQGSWKKIQGAIGAADMFYLQWLTQPEADMDSSPGCSKWCLCKYTEQRWHVAKQVHHDARGHCYK